MEYEAGMQIIWDVVTREIVVLFRGSVTMLPQKFDNRDEGIQAGEEVCRNAGWGETLITDSGS
jgi:hypothetical protein